MIKRLAENADAPVAIEIRLAGETVFLYAMDGTTPASKDWARRKRNIVELLQRSFYAVGLADELANISTIGEMGLANRDFACHGGSFPCD